MKPALLPAQDANWTTYYGNPASHHHSSLTQITPANAANLELKWTFQAQSLEKFEVTPLIVDGVMYITEGPNTVIALDPATGREFWIYEHKNPNLPLLRQSQSRPRHPSPDFSQASLCPSRRDLSESRRGGLWPKKLVLALSGH